MASDSDELKAEGCSRHTNARLTRRNALFVGLVALFSAPLVFRLFGRQFNREAVVIADVPPGNKRAAVAESENPLVDVHSVLVKSGEREATAMIHFHFKGEVQADRWLDVTVEALDASGKAIGQSRHACTDARYLAQTQPFVPVVASEKARRLDFNSEIFILQLKTNGPINRLKLIFRET